MTTRQEIEQIEKSLEAFKPDIDTYPDDYFAWLTCQLACEAVAQGNFGVGCMLVDAAGDVVTKGKNEVFSPHFRSDRHAEMVVMDAFEDQYPHVTDMSDYTLYTSLEPCPMCAGALVLARIDRLVYGCDDSKAGACGSLYNIVQDQRLNHRLEVTKGVLADDCSKILQNFFHKKRKKPNAVD